MKTDIEIAQEAVMEPIARVAEQARCLSLPTNTKETLPVRISIW